MTLQEAVNQIESGGYVVDIGQINLKTRAYLKRHYRCGDSWRYPTNKKVYFKAMLR